MRFSDLVLSNLIKGKEIKRVHLASEQQRDVVCKLYALLCLVFLGTAPIIYEQATILNLSHFEPCPAYQEELYRTSSYVGQGCLMILQHHVSMLYIRSALSIDLSILRIA